MAGEKESLSTECVRPVPKAGDQPDFTIKALLPRTTSFSPRGQYLRGVEKRNSAELTAAECFAAPIVAAKLHHDWAR
jgi:hypothetical protein